MRFEAFARTDAGPVRENNEDSMLIDLEAGLFVVADGMGGHASGEVASEIAVHTVKEILLGGQDPEETRLNRPLEEEESIRERLRYGMNQASVRICQKAFQNERRCGIACTHDIHPAFSKSPQCTNRKANDFSILRHPSRRT